jgi:hypothetical protein
VLDEGRAELLGQQLHRVRRLQHLHLQGPVEPHLQVTHVGVHYALIIIGMLLRVYWIG